MSMIEKYNDELKKDSWAKAALFLGVVNRRPCKKFPVCAEHAARTKVSKSHLKSLDNSILLIE